MKTLIKHILTFAALATLTITATLANAQVEYKDRIVAIVDDDVVLASELDARLELIQQNAAKAGREAPPAEQIRSDVLEQLIIENIQLQRAQRVGVRISDAQLNEAMLRVARQNNMDLLQFKAALEQGGGSYNATREQIRQELMIQRVQQGHVNQRVQITDQEITNFLDSEEGGLMASPEYNMLHTLVQVSSGSSEADINKAKAYADSLYQRIQQGEAYEQVMSGQHPFPLNGSNLGWRKTQELPGLLSGLTETLGEGETAAPIKSPSGFHIVKMQDTRGVDEVIDQTKARHILLEPSAIRDEEATETEINSLRERILAGEDFAELAREFSEDIGSALEGGDLGWTSPGQLVGAFQQTMDNTEIDEISLPFRSEYGWHILQVLERREKDVTEDIRKNIARNFIHKRKFDDELQTWLQKIRDEAYVDFK